MNKTCTSTSSLFVTHQGETMTLFFATLNEVIMLIQICIIIDVLRFINVVYNDL